MRLYNDVPHSTCENGANASKKLDDKKTQGREKVRFGNLKSARGRGGSKAPLA